MGWRSAMGQAAFGIPGNMQGISTLRPTGPAQPPVNPGWQAGAQAMGVPGANPGMWQAGAPAVGQQAGSMDGMNAANVPNIGSANASAVGPVIAQAIGPAGQASPSQYSAADISGYIKQQGYVDANGNVTNPQGIYDASLKYGVDPSQIDGAMGWGAGTSQNWINSHGQQQAAAAQGPASANQVGGYIAQGMQSYGSINPVLRYPRY